MWAWIHKVLHVSLSHSISRLVSTVLRETLCSNFSFSVFNFPSKGHRLLLFTDEMNYQTTYLKCDQTGVVQSSRLYFTITAIKMWQIRNQRLNYCEQKWTTIPLLHTQLSKKFSITKVQYSCRHTVKKEKGFSDRRFKECDWIIDVWSTFEYGLRTFWFFA